MKVIQFKRHKLEASSSDCFESRIVTDLYICVLFRNGRGKEPGTSNETDHVFKWFQVVCR
jgi:hypothetical protein